MAGSRVFFGDLPPCAGFLNKNNRTKETLWWNPAPVGGLFSLFTPVRYFDSPLGSEALRCIGEDDAKAGFFKSPGFGTVCLSAFCLSRAEILAEHEVEPL